jgi:hypothetical protein
MTSDEVMNDYAKCEGENNRIEEEKEEQRLEKALFNKTLKNMKRENQNPKQKN